VSASVVPSGATAAEPDGAAEAIRASDAGRAAEAREAEATRGPGAGGAAEAGGVGEKPGAGAAPGAGQAIGASDAGGAADATGAGETIRAADATRPGEANRAAEAGGPVDATGAGDSTAAAEATRGGEAIRAREARRAGDAVGTGERPPAFAVRLENFEGPFDLLLSLISKHQLDVTEVALSRVTDEFIAHIHGLGPSWDLGQATEFLVVAATLLDLKAARLLPSAEVEDEEDLALLEARDLLFARLLQYRAYKQAAAHLGVLERAQARRFGRAVPLDPRFAELMPEVLMTVSPEQLARIAAEALRPKPPPTVSIEHVHAPRVSVREQAVILRERLARSRRSTFRALTQDCQHTTELVARFLALLELYREGVVAFDQVAPLGELWMRWTGGDRETEPADAENVDEEYG
jgi:segregation and condensation protein A